MTSDIQTKKAQAVDLYQFEGTEVRAIDDDSARLHGYFPLSPGTPNASDVAGDDIMMVCMEIRPGNYLPTHTDSSEELLVVTAGTVAASIDGETVELSTGQCAVVPEMAPHSLETVGNDPARVLGIFADDELTATFETTLEPFGTNVVSIGGDADQS
jgi:quercetin dioxygenase-like cupin family protein